MSVHVPAGVYAATAFNQLSHTLNLMRFTVAQHRENQGESYHTWKVSQQRSVNYWVRTAVAQRREL